MRSVLFYAVSLALLDHLGYNLESTNLCAAAALVCCELWAQFWNRFTRWLDQHQPQEKVHYEDD